MSIAHRSTVAVRRVLTRRPWLYWLGVIALAAAVAAAAQHNLNAVERARTSWGETTAVWVATGEIEVGEPLRANIDVRHVARAMVPVHAVTADAPDTPDDTLEPDMLDVVARQRISEGEIITSVDVTATDDQLALVPLDWLAVAVTESPVSGATVGSRVQVAADGVVIAADALVVGAVEGSTLIAVPADVAPLVPLAAEHGALALLRVP